MLFQNSLLKRTWPVVIQCANATRKPRWLPVAKSKIYRIPKRPVITPEERLELQRIHNNYKTQMRAIKRFYYDEMIREKATTESASSELSLNLEADDWDKCVRLNDEWNAKIAAEREERRKIELDSMEERALARMEKKDRELKDLIVKASQEIRAQKELSSTFITADNIDEAIEQALANTADYNYAIDLQGKQIVGKDTSGVEAKPQKTNV